MTPSPHIFRHHAMATWFEIRVAIADEPYARQAAQEAFRQIEHIESLLSRFRENSEISTIAQLREGESVVVSPETFECLTRAMELSALTGGAFDPGLGNAMDRWRSASGDGAVAATADLPVTTATQTPASATTGTHDVPTRGTLVLNTALRAVARQGPPVALDLGAIGKGYAIDKVAELLAEWEVGPCLIVGGGSSILATGPAGEGWDVGITATSQLRLMEGSVSSSGLSVKGAHILDPRTGESGVTPARVWVLAAHATVSDALSTAFMIMPQEDIEVVCEQRPDIGVIIQARDESPEILRIGRAFGVHYGFSRVV